MAVLWRVMSFSDGVVSRAGRAGERAGGGEKGMVAVDVGERWI